MIVLRCAVCDASVDISTPLSWKCPNATDTDRSHVLGFHDDRHSITIGAGDNPFLRYQQNLYVDAFGEALGIAKEERKRIISDADAAVKKIGGTGFLVSPFQREDRLSEELGFSPSGGVWVKDETHNVAGSHKARHIFTELLHLLFAEHAG